MATKKSKGSSKDSDKKSSKKAEESVILDDVKDDNEASVENSENATNLSPGPDEIEDGETPDESQPEYETVYQEPELPRLIIER